MDTTLAGIAAYLLTRSAADTFDPISMPRTLLPSVFVLGIEHGQGASIRSRIRLTGTAIDAALGSMLRDRYLDVFMHGPQSVQVLSAFNRCAETGEPLWMRQIASVGGKAPRYVEGVAVRVTPLRISGGLVVGVWAKQTITTTFECAPLDAAALRHYVRPVRT